MENRRGISITLFSLMPSGSDGDAAHEAERERIDGHVTLQVHIHELSCFTVFVG